ncbi:hypothetical protein GOODEAATRI_010144, partial [Goodea atripinnis]
LDPFYASIILFVGRAWDAITDPTVGFLVSRSRWTSIGRMMPWILFSTPFAVLTYFLIWYVPSFEEGKVIWYLVFYCLFQSMQTVSSNLTNDFPFPVSMTPLTVSNPLFLVAVLPCAVFSAHHVYQQRPEGAGLCHRLSYVEQSA